MSRTVTARHGRAGQHYGIAESTKHTIREMVHETPRRHRAFMVKRLADIYGLHPSTIYRFAELNGPKRLRRAVGLRKKGVMKNDHEPS